MRCPGPGRPAGPCSLLATVCTYGLRQAFRGGALNRGDWGALSELCASNDPSVTVAPSPDFKVVCQCVPVTVCVQHACH